MKKFYSELSVNAQNAYADLFDSVLSLNLLSVRKLNGSFNKKIIKNKEYWYFQYRGINRNINQIYIGPESDKLSELIKIQKDSEHSSKEISSLASSAIALGCEPLIPKHFRVIRRLDEYGFFKRGGILVGTHAYLSMCNMLGIKPEDSMQTQDVDFAHAGKNISVAMPSNINIKVSTAIESLELGLIPISSGEKIGASYLNPSEPSFRLDFLTSKTSEDDHPIYIKELGVSLQPLKFMEFSMINTLQSTVFCKEGAVLVNIPDPSRFAIHKLIVSQERKQSEMAKINKDIRQANVLIQYYINTNQYKLIETLNEAYENGPGWAKRINSGIQLLSNINCDASLFLSSSIRK